MIEGIQTPDYVFAASWEVCNKVGGIYTVLSTQANTLKTRFGDKLFYIGPDVWQGKENPLFIESDNLCATWREYANEKDGLSVRVGRWNIPGEPIVILVDFRPFFPFKNQIYTDMWNRYQVDSLHAYGDYDEASMFAYATGRVVESFYRYNLTETDKVIFHAHEWMLGMAALYLQTNVPEIATVFTTHATSIGRSIAGNNKPLYDYLFAYNGDQMAEELNMQSKHSIEKQTAHYVDCFTTVSQITNNECRELLDKSADVILMNGFEDDFVPKGQAYVGKRKRARALKLRVANCLTGQEFDDDTLIIATSGRYEFKNKGIDVFLEALNRLNRDKNLKKNVLAFVNVPGWVGDPREDLQQRMKSKEKFTTPLPCPLITHWLHDMTHDQVLDMLKYLDLNNRPWGYTPLESVAFHVPTITTDLAGFGLWVKSLRHQHGIEDGVEVLHRSDYNYSEVADGVKDTISLFSSKTPDEVKAIRKRAGQVAEQALWKHFIQYYYEAYDIALRNAMKRLLG